VTRPDQHDNSSVRQDGKASPAQPLKEQAEFFRSRAPEGAGEYYAQALGPGRMLFYLGSVLAAVTAAVFLLAAPGSRREMVALVAEGLSGPGAEEEIFRLPPPPPPVQTQITALGPVGSGSSSSDESPGVLFLDEFPERPEDVSEPRMEAAAVIKNQENEAAYELLQENSQVVAALLAGEIPEMNFLSWSPVKNDPPEFWIDLTVERQTDAQEVHLIWSVNTDTQRITPLSQAARDLAPR